MTIIAKHLRCDVHNICSQCSDYLWSPEKKEDHAIVYYHCNFCKLDILCERGVGMRFSQDDQRQISKTYTCIKCGGKLEERIWPSGDKLK